MKLMFGGKKAQTFYTHSAATIWRVMTVFYAQAPQMLIYMHTHKETHRQHFYLHTITAQAANPIKEGKHNVGAKTLLISQ